MNTNYSKLCSQYRSSFCDSNVKNENVHGSLISPQSGIYSYVHPSVEQREGVSKLESSVISFASRLVLVLYSDWVKYARGGCESPHRDVKVSSAPITPAYSQLFYGVSSPAPLIFLSTITTLLSLTLGNQHYVIFYYHKLRIRLTEPRTAHYSVYLLLYTQYIVSLRSRLQQQPITDQSRKTTNEMPRMEANT